MSYRLVDIEQYMCVVESAVQEGATEMQVIPYQAKFSFMGLAQWLVQIVGAGGGGGGANGARDVPRTFISKRFEWWYRYDFDVSLHFF